MINLLLAETARLFTGAQERWVGCAPDVQPRVYFANHTSHFDFVVLWASLPPPLRRRTRPVAGRDYWDRGPIRRCLASEVFRAVLIERKPSRCDCHAMVDALRTPLQHGESLILFPEGTRGTGPEIGEFKSGLFHLLRAQPETEAIPAYIENLNRVMPKGEVLPVPLLCSVAFGAPLKLEPAEGKEPFLARARAAIQALADAK